MKSRVVVGAIIKKGAAILLGKPHLNSGPYPNTWHIPGGGVNLGHESLEEALLREIKEETGIAVKNIKRLSFSDDTEPDKNQQLTYYIFLIYFCEYAMGTVKAADDMMCLEWVPIKKLSTIPLPRPSQKLFRELGWM